MDFPRCGCYIDCRVESGLSKSISDTASEEPDWESALQHCADSACSSDPAESKGKERYANQSVSLLLQVMQINLNVEAGLLNH